MDYRVLYVGTQVIFGLLFLVLFYLRHTDDRSEKFDMLDALYLIFFTTIVLDIIWIFIDGVPELRTFHTVHQAIYLSVLSLTGYAWINYALDALPTQNMKINKHRKLLALPVLFLVIMALTSFKTGLMYTIDEGGYYVRGPLQPVAVGISLFYLILASLIALRCRKDALFTMDKKRFGVIALFPVPVMVLAIVQFMLPPGLPGAPGGALITLLLIFGTSQNVLITRDYLTGLPNRYMFEQRLLDRMGKYRVEGFKCLYLIEGDLNKFKNINDTYGHLAGDNALQEAAKILSRFFEPYEATVFRTGGDEFMVRVETVEPLDYEAIQQGLNEALAEGSPQGGATLSMSLGFEEYNDTDSFRTLIDKADKRLYAVKQHA